MSLWNYFSLSVWWSLWLRSCWEKSLTNICLLSANCRMSFLINISYLNLMWYSLHACYRYQFTKWYLSINWYHFPRVQTIYPYLKPGVLNIGYILSCFSLYKFMIATLQEYHVYVNLYFKLLFTSCQHLIVTLHSFSSCHFVFLIHEETQKRH